MEFIYIREAMIDSHHHFWHYDPVEYNWITDDMAAIRRDFVPETLKETLAGTGVEGVVSIHARQSLEETGWLMELASENEFIKGIVGWLHLTSENISDLLDQYASNQWLKGVRHVVQGEPDPEFILGKAFNHGVSLLKSHNLVYDILIFDHQLPNAIRFVDLHPDQSFVIDHIAKPKIKINEISDWRKNIKEIARRPNVFCKISGMVTEADFRLWTPAQLQPYIDGVLEAFGPGRLLFGSDWPVCLVATSYRTWLETVKNALPGLSASEKSGIFGLNAKEIYNL